MKYEPKKIFIIENGQYVEITYQKFIELYKMDTSYREKHFIPIERMYLEVSKEEYKDYYREIERNRYLKKLDIKHSIFFIGALDEEEGKCYLSDLDENVQDIVEQRLMISQLKNCLSKLTQDEYQLIQLHYFQNMSQEEIGKQFGISQQAVSKRLKKIYEKLRKLMNN